MFIPKYCSSFHITDLQCRVLLVLAKNWEKQPGKAKVEAKEASRVRMKDIVVCVICCIAVRSSRRDLG